MRRIIIFLSYVSKVFSLIIFLTLKIIKLDHRSSAYQPWNFLIYTSLSLLVISLLTVITWHILTYKKYRNFSTSLQKTLTVLPYISLIYAVCLYNYFTSIENIDEINDQSMAIKSYLITILITLGSIYRTIFWFLLILIAYVSKYKREIKN